MYKVLILVFLFISCEQKSVNESEKIVETIRFHADAKSSMLADKVMEASGGMNAWKNTKGISWNFFGARNHTWDKIDKTDIITVPDKGLKYTINLDTQEGEIVKNGEKVTHPDSVKMHMKTAYGMWVNDSYWLCMPFKLKDDGVNLKYVSQDTSLDGRLCEVIEMTFDNVGLSPQNKYLVYIDAADHLVRQWDYYAQSTDSLARFQSLWPNYKKYGDLMLSGGEIRDRKITDIVIH